MTEERLNTVILQYTESITYVIILLISCVLYCFTASNVAHKIVMFFALLRLLVQAILVIAYGANYIPYHHSIVVPMADYLMMMALDIETWGKCLRQASEQFPHVQRFPREMLAICVFSVAICIFVTLHDEQYILASKRPLMTFSMLSTYYVFVYALWQVVVIHMHSKKERKTFFTLNQYERDIKLRELIQNDSKEQELLIYTLYAYLATDFVCHVLLSSATILFILSFDCEQESDFLAFHLPGRALQVVAQTIYMVVDCDKIMQRAAQPRRLWRHLRESRVAVADQRPNVQENPTNAVEDAQRDM